MNKKSAQKQKKQNITTASRRPLFFTVSGQQTTKNALTNRASFGGAAGNRTPVRLDTYYPSTSLFDFEKRDRTLKANQNGPVTLQMLHSAANSVSIFYRPDRNVYKTDLLAPTTVRSIVASLLSSDWCECWSAESVSNACKDILYSYIAFTSRIRLAK